MRKQEGKSPVKVSDLFEVYRKRLRAPQKSVIEASVEVIHDVLGVTINSESLLYSAQSRTLTVHARGPLKSEITLHKEDILNHLRGRLGPRSAPTTLL